MRRSTAALLSLALAVLPLAAQQPFEGTITMKMNFTPQQNTVIFSTNGIKTATTTSLNLGQTPLDVRIVIDNKTGSTVALMPMPPQLGQMMQGAAGIRMNLDAMASGAGTSKTTAAAATPPKKLGTSQTIAGMRCDDYESQDTVKVRACITQVLGAFVMPKSTGGLGGMAEMPAWARGMTTGYPLKVWTPADGKVLMEVVTTERKSIPASTFEIPADYIDGSAMMGGMMGGGMRGGRAGRGGGGF